MKKLVPQSIKNIYHLCQAVLANFMYSFPSRKIKIIGVTGTNGKTTVCQMITKILEETGKKVAMASTINFKLGGKTWVNETKFTTLSSFKVQKFIKRAVDSGAEFLVLETSSHSLDQNRTWGVRYDTAVITNITREHLDYHKTMEKYHQAKLKLFRNIRAAVVNLDMKNPEDYLDSEAKEAYGYTTGDRNFNSKLKIVKAWDVEQYSNYSKFKIKNLEFSLNLPGLFNIENALAAICVGLAHGINLETVKIALGKIKIILGRMEYVPNNRGINIIIDYAVTPDSLQKLYELIQKINTKKMKVVSVFGACGERDRGKRPIMGEIVDKYADNIILTNEDPHNEDPSRIVEEIAEGIKNKREGMDFWKIMDRKEAIKKALLLAKPGDFMVITGKGAEVTMAIGKKRIPWSDKKVILEELEKI